MLKTVLIDDFKYDLIYASKVIDWNQYGIQIVGTAESGRQALEQMEELKPDLVITDIQMPEMDGFTLSRRIKEKFPDVKIVFMSCHSDFIYAKEAMKLNIMAYITKPLIQEDVQNTIHTVAEAIEKEKNSRIEIQQMNDILNETLSSFKKQNEIMPKIKELMLIGTRQDLEEYILEHLKFVGDLAEDSYLKTRALTMVIALEMCVRELGGDLDTILGSKAPYWSIINSFHTCRDVFLWVNETFLSIKSWNTEKCFDENSLRIDKVKEYIHSDYMHELTVKTIADRLFLSPNYANTFFKQHMGVSIPDYITSVRIEKAKELLANLDLKLFNVVSSVGYNHIPHFNKIFKEKVGLSLGEYRRKVSGRQG